MVMPYHLHMPSYFLETFTEYPYEEKLKLTLKRKMPISVAALTGIDSKQFFK